MFSLLCYVHPKSWKTTNMAENGYIDERSNYSLAMALFTLALAHILRAYSKEVEDT